MLWGASPLYEFESLKEITIPQSEPAEELIQLLLDHGAQTDLFQAAAMGRTGLIEFILDRDGKLIDSTDDQGKTALFHAAQNNRLAAAKTVQETSIDETSGVSDHA